MLRIFNLSKRYKNLGRFSLRKSAYTKKAFKPTFFPLYSFRGSRRSVFSVKRRLNGLPWKGSFLMSEVKAKEKRGYDESLSVIFCANPCSHPASVKKGTFQTLLFSSLRFHSFQSRKCTQFSGVVNKPASFGDALGSILEDHRPEKEKVKWRLTDFLGGEENFCIKKIPKNWQSDFAI